MCYDVHNVIHQRMNLAGLKKGSSIERLCEYIYSRNGCTLNEQIFKIKPREICDVQNLLGSSLFENVEVRQCQGQDNFHLKGVFFFSQLN